MKIQRVEFTLAASIGAIAVAIFFLTAFLPHIGNLGLVDNDSSFYYVESMRKAIQEYGVSPMWDPWHMGGMPLAGNPNSVISPLYFPVLVHGTVAGLKISMILFHWIGFMSTWLLARKLRLANHASICAALIWSLSGLHAIQMQAGFLLSCHLHLMPLAAFCLLMAENDYRWVVPPALCIALAFLGGSPYPVAIFLPLFVIFAVGGAIKKKSPRPLISFAVATLLSIPIAAIKLFPALSWMHEHRRELGSLIEGYSISALGHALLDHRLNLQFPTPSMYSGGFFPGTTFYWAPEYGMYMGPLVLILALAGFMGSLSRKAEVTAAFAIFLLLCMGDYSIMPLSTWIKILPVYDGMRVVTRFRWPLVLMMSILAGAGAEVIVRKFPKRELALMALAILASLNLYIANFHLLRDAFPVPAEKVLPAVTNDTGLFYQRGRGRSYGPDGWVDQQRSKLYVADNASFPFLLQNVGVVNGYEPFDLTLYATGVESPSYHGEAFIFSAGQFINPQIVSWTPNKVELRWPGGVEGTLFLNQNYRKGWGVCDGSGLPMIRSGLVAVHINERTKGVALCYEEPHFRLYAALSAVSFAAALIFCAAMFAALWRKDSSAKAGPPA